MLCDEGVSVQMKMSLGLVEMTRLKLYKRMKLRHQVRNIPTQCVHEGVLSQLCSQN